MAGTVGSARMWQPWWPDAEWHSGAGGGCQPQASALRLPAGEWVARARAPSQSPQLSSGSRCTGDHCVHDRWACSCFVSLQHCRVAKGFLIVIVVSSICRASSASHCEAGVDWPPGACACGSWSPVLSALPLFNQTQSPASIPRGAAVCSALF